MIGLGNCHDVIISTNRTAYYAIDLTAIGLRVGSVSRLDVIPASGTISLSGAALSFSGTCTVTAVVKASEGTYLNSAQLTSANGGPGNMASDTLVAVTPPNSSKTLGAVNIGVGNKTGLSFTLTNPNPIVTLHGLQFSDTLPDGLVAATPTNGAVLGYIANTTSSVTSNEAQPGAAASAVIFVGDPFQISYAANLGAAAIGSASLANGLKSLGTTLHATPAAGTMA
jgi:hypothetical protein